MASQQSPDDDPPDAIPGATAGDDGPGDGVPSGVVPNSDTPNNDTPDGDTSSTSAATAAVGHPVLLYTVARILVFLVVAGILYLFGARGFLLLLLAVIISGLISFILLNRLRDQVSERVAARMDASKERRERAAAAEDDIY